MKNKNVGFLIIGMALVIGLIVFLFNNAMTSIVNASCSHGPSCSMYGTIKTQTYIGIALIAMIIVIGFVLIFAKEEMKIVTKTKTIKEQVEVKRKPIDYSKLDKEEKLLVKLIEEAEGSIFQSDLVDKSQFGKVKVSRVLDRLEGKQIIERKRRGMTNFVVLKN